MRDGADSNVGRCGIGFWGGQRPSLAGCVTVTGPKPGRPLPEGVHVAYPPGTSPSPLGYELTWSATMAAVRRPGAFSPPA